MRASDVEQLFFYINIVQYGLAGFLHCTGMLVLSKYPKKTNQNVILFYLSLTEVNLVIPGIMLRIHLDKGNYLTNAPRSVVYVIESTATYELVFMMYILTVDRLICSINPLKYRCRVTKRRIRIAVLLTVIFSFILSFMKEGLYHLIEKNVRLIIDQMVYYIIMIIGSAYVLVAIVTYIFIFWTARKSRTTTAQNAQQARGGSGKKRYLITGVIILTYLFLYVFPYTFQARRYFVLTDMQRTLVNVITRSLMMVGMLVDPIIYIFLSKHYRAILITKFRMICQCCQKQPKRTPPAVANSGASKEAVASGSKEAVESGSKEA